MRQRGKTLDLAVFQIRGAHLLFKAARLFVSATWYRQQLAGLPTSQSSPRQDG